MDGGAAGERSQGGAHLQQEGRSDRIDERLGSSPVWEPPSTAAPVTQRGSDPSPSSSPPGPDSISVREECLSPQGGLAHDFEAISIESQPLAPARNDSTNAADQDLSSTPHISPSLHQLQEPFEEGQTGERLPRSQSGSSIASSSHSSYLGGSGRRAKRQADATSGEGAAGPSAWNRGSSQMASISSPPPQSPSKSNRPRSSSFNTPSPSSSRPQTADAMSPPSSSVKERPRSSTWRSPSAAVPNIDDAPQTTPRSSFTMLARSASRRSVYSAFNFVDHSAEPMPSLSTSSRINRDELPPSPPKERRRLFSRSRSSLPVSDGSNATQTSPMLRAQPGGSGGGGSNGKGIVRRISSRTFFGKERDRSNDEAMRSTDSLASTSSTARQETGAKKTGGMLGRTATLPNWAKKKKGNKGSDASETSEGPQGLARASMESYASVTSSAATGPPPPPPVSAPSPPEPETLSNSSRRLGLGIAEEEEESQQRSKSLHPPNPDQSEEGGLPRRLSGWLLNMIGSEGVQPSPGLSVSPPTRPDISQQKGPSSSDLADTNVTSPSASALSTSPTSGARTKAGGGILSSLSNTGRNRTEGATGGVGNSARSGLDRALRYFLDSGEQNDDEGIWLLGVWHGPKTDVVSSERRQQQQQQVHGPSIEISGASPRAPKTAQQGASKATVGSESSSSPLHHHMDLDGDDESSNSSARRTRETSPSIASASTGGSLGRKAKRPSTPEAQVEIDDGNDHVVARNPPTPQTSPVPGHSRSSNGTSAGTPFVSAPTRGASASSSMHDKTLPAGPSFQVDFCSRVWCTYRSHFVPIARDGSISSQAENAAAEAAQQQAAANADAGSPATPIGVRTGWLGRRTGEGNASTDALAVIVSPSQQQSGLGASLGIPTPSGTSPGSNSGGGSLGEKMGIPNLWGRATAAAQAVGLGGRSGLTTDAGWGCMLRTGQSVLANALIDTHLGRDWRRQSAAPALSNAAPSIEEDREAHGAWRRARAEYASYVKIISWFMDEPSLACPFGVHRMAREGKRLGKEVGEWFGPSTAAGAIKKLVDEYPQCGIGVSVATDGAVYLDQVRQAAQTPGAWTKKQWGRPVLILIGIRLGLDGVHPTYYESVKKTFTFPQSVGIAGGRPSSSYYFVGYQGASLFYLDPHHVRSCVPFRHPPPYAATEDKTEAAEEWWAHAYGEQELASFHCDRPRRMPMKSLDPSMLLGFLCQDEASLSDLVQRVKELPKTIFSILEAPPKWMEDDMDDEEDERALESFSESSTDGRDADVDSNLHDQAEGKEEGDGEKVERETEDGEVDSPTEDNLGSSHMTATPRTEGTFEFVNGGGRSGASPQISMRRHDVRLASNASSNRTTRAAADASSRPSSPPSMQRSVSSSTQPQVEQSPNFSQQQQHDESLSGAYSVVSDSDAGSTWEEVDRPAVPSSPPRTRTQATFGGQAPSLAELGNHHHHHQQQR